MDDVCQGCAGARRKSTWKRNGGAVSGIQDVNDLLVFGAGGHGRVVAEAAADQYSDIAFVDDDTDLSGSGNWPVLGLVSDVLSGKLPCSKAAVAIGDNAKRLGLIDRLIASDIEVASIVHRSAVLSASAIVGAGSVLLAHAVVSSGAQLGRGCIVNTGATIDHDCELADGVHVSPGAHLAGNVTVGSCAWIGLGAVVREGTVIGSGAVVGAGAAVVTDIADGSRVVGVPAKTRQ